MSDAKRERQPKADLLRDLGASLTTPLELEEPSPHVDERIFAMARAELDARARGDRRLVRWIEIGVAAAVLLVAALLFKDWGEDPAKPKTEPAPLATSGAVADFAVSLLDDESDVDDEDQSPPLAVADLRADIELLVRIARTAPIDSETEKNQLLERLDRCVQDLRELEARVRMKPARIEALTPEEGDPR